MIQEFLESNTKAIAILLLILFGLILMAIFGSGFLGNLNIGGIF